MRRIRVPLSVDAQVRIPVGPIQLQLRAVILLAIVAPFAVASLQLGFLATTWRIGIMLGLFMLAYTVAAPTREGIWMGTWFVYRQAHRLIATAVIRGTAHRAVVSAIGQGVQVSNSRGLFTLKNRRFTSMSLLASLRHYTGIPAVASVEPGIIHLDPGGARVVLLLEGPAVSVSSDSYLHWCQRLMNWLTSVDCPSQLLTVMNHLDGEKAMLAFDHRVENWPVTPLFETERELAGHVSGHSLGLSHYVVFSPGLADKDGIPPLSRITRVGKAVEASVEDAHRVLQSALRVAPSFGIGVSLPDRDDISALLRQTILGAQDAAVGDGILRIGDQHHVVLTITKLPPTIEVGVVIDAMMRAQSRGIASLHILPVDPQLAREALNRTSAMYRYASGEGRPSIDSDIAMADITEVLAAIAQRELKPCRVALTLSLSHPERDVALAAAERLHGILQGAGFDTQLATGPGFRPALALSPGGAPLGRSLLLTSDGAALRMVPALGTPFSDQSQPLVGMNVLTGAPAYMSVWSPANHNMVIVGSSGAGKSVATKTLLIRHVMEGVSAVVIDPDSEYQSVMTAIGGAYFELGTDALNPLAAGVGIPPDTAASLVLPILSVMAGDEKGIRDGRPIRRLPDEDQGWLHAEIANFYRSWAAQHPQHEPVLSNLINFIDHDVMARVLTPREAERCHIMTARLRRFTQGKRAEVFDRPSTFVVGRRPVAIGLKVFAMSYGADLTPALAVVLTSILAAIDRREGRMVIVVDEAHRVTSDPDAGEVLGQLVRQARKYGAGVWMCSQRVEDFVHTELGKTLAATAATKLILGAEEAAIEDVRDVFKLTEEEISAISPLVQGRGVLLSGNQRTVVNVIPGWLIMALANTSSMLNLTAGADRATRIG